MNFVIWSHFKHKSGYFENIDFPYSEGQWGLMLFKTQHSLYLNICVPQKKESHTCLEHHEDA